ncbi:hypothetical protein PSTT_06500, partial [Puccinia striiformis]
MASQQNTANHPTWRAPHTSKGTKLATICGHIEKLCLTPKSFITVFLQHSAINMAFCRRFWGTETGWKSTRGLLDTMQGVICLHVEGKKLWHEWVLEQFPRKNPAEASILRGGYISSTAITQDFFTEDVWLVQNQGLTDSMLFLYHLVRDKIHTYDSDDEDGGTEAYSNTDNDEFAMQDASLADESNGEEVQDPELKKQLLALSEQDVNKFEGYGLVKNTNPAHSKQICADTFLIQLLKLETGSNYLQLSHQNKLDLQSINNFLRMAKGKGLNDDPTRGFTPVAHADIYVAGIQKLQLEGLVDQLECFRPDTKASRAVV